MPEGEIFLFDLTSFKHKQGVTLFQSRRLFYMDLIATVSFTCPAILPNLIRNGDLK